MNTIADPATFDALQDALSQVEFEEGVLKDAVIGLMPLINTPGRPPIDEGTLFPVVGYAISVAAALQVSAEHLDPVQIIERAQLFDPEEPADLTRAKAIALDQTLAEGIDLAQANPVLAQQLIAVRERVRLLLSGMGLDQLR